MKAKSSISIFAALLFAGLSVGAQDLDDVYIDDNITGTPLINNYSGDYNYFYTSRIYRFHRPFIGFDYYSPFFTDTYWYTYQPFNIGLSIYGGCFGLSLGCNFNWPFWYSDYYPYYYNPVWNDPWFYGYNYWGYRPYYYNYWYSPVVLNPWAWNRWNYPYHGWDWHDGYRYNHFYRNDFRNDNYSYRSENRRRGDGSTYSANSSYGRNRYSNSSGSRDNNSQTINNRRVLSGIDQRHNTQPLSGSLRPVRASDAGQRKTGSYSTGRTTRIADAGTGIRQRPGQVNTISNNKINRSVVNNPRSGNSVRVNQARIASDTRTKLNTAKGIEKRNFNYTRESPAVRRSFTGSVKTASQSRPLTGVQNRSFSERRSGNMNIQGHSFQRSGGSGVRSGASTSGQHSRRR